MEFSSQQPCQFQPKEPCPHYQISRQISHEQLWQHMYDRVQSGAMEHVKLQDILERPALLPIHHSLYLRLLADLRRRLNSYGQLFHAGGGPAKLLAQRCSMAYIVAAALYCDRNSVACAIATAFIHCDIDRLTPQQKSALEAAFPTEARANLLTTQNLFSDKKMTENLFYDMLTEDFDV